MTDGPDEKRFFDDHLDTEEVNDRVFVFLNSLQGEGIPNHVLFIGVMKALKPYFDALPLSDAEDLAILFREIVKADREETPQEHDWSDLLEAAQKRLASRT